MNASLSTIFVMSDAYSFFTELNIMVVWLRDATSLQDNKCSDLLAQWMSSPPLIRARFSEAMDHAPLPAVHKTKVQAIRTYAEALFPAPYLIGDAFVCKKSSTPSGTLVRATRFCIACNRTTFNGSVVIRVLDMVPGKHRPSTAYSLLTSTL